ncbi:hypothetical protein [Halobacillus sp. Marseille-P3879]|uniref:hypothetical protein n=1 Tax=Halobacillus sp. Marseille-P3879 TaxID=2045014 RepID=UPI000C7D4289|nr:hypothetical protein [Halobacillus sp. Marseille-P3879]
MEVKQHHSVKDFLKTTETLLLEREAENNLPLGILHNQKQMNADELYMLTIHHEGECIYSIMRTPPHYWILPSVDVDHKQPVKTLVEYLAEHSFKVPGVIGEASAAEAFVQAYREKNRGLAELHMRQGVYELKKVNELQKCKREAAHSQEAR